MDQEGKEETHWRAEDGPVITLWVTPTARGEGGPGAVVALVWTATEAVELRQRHRLVGAYLGHAGAMTTASETAAAAGSLRVSEDSDEGDVAEEEEEGDGDDVHELDHEEEACYRDPVLPLALMPEEVALLLERRPVLLVLQPGSMPMSASLAAQQAWHARRASEMQDYRAQREALADAQRHNHLLTKGMIPPGNKPRTLPPAPLHPISMPSSLTHFPWGAEECQGVRVHSLAHARALGLWSYPTTPAQVHRFQVFCALYNQGYYLTSGLKFGGDWLAYPGDPALHHSALIVTVVGLHDLIHARQLVTHGRLGNTVKKLHALCAWDVSGGRLISTCIQWTGWTSGG